MRRLIVPALLLALVATACGGDDGQEQTSSPPTGVVSSGSGQTPATPTAGSTESPTGATPASPTGPIPTGEPNLDAVQIELVQVADTDHPLAMAVRSGDQRLYVAGQFGSVDRLPPGGGEAEPMLDLSGDMTAGGERGLLGLAFSPDGSFLYVNYTDRLGDTRVVEFAMAGDQVDAASRRDVLQVGQPYANHNGGNLVFGPDGHLYIGLGDGGSGGDPMDNGQRLDTLLGKMLRIDPRPDGDRAYGIPADNPFVGTNALPEIWAFGLRNPWRYEFDRATGDLWIGDVGQGSREEIDFQPADSAGGENYGWNRMEGTLEYSGDPPDDDVLPVFEYSQSDRPVCAVTGGYVYRGLAIPDLVGAYLYADFCEGLIFALHVRDGEVIAHRELGQVVPQLSSFGQDQDGELYALSLEGPIYRIEAAV